jgi:Holliday junction DNA helicase RuvB
MVNSNLDPTDANFTAAEREIDKVLRPQGFDDFTGQQSILDNLKIFVEAAKGRDHPVSARQRWLILLPMSLGLISVQHPVRCWISRVTWRDYSPIWSPTTYYS